MWTSRNPHVYVGVDQKMHINTFLAGAPWPFLHLHLKLGGQEHFDSQFSFKLNYKLGWLYKASLLAWLFKASSLAWLVVQSKSWGKKGDLFTPPISVGKWTSTWGSFSWLLGSTKWKQNAQYLKWTLLGGFLSEIVMELEVGGNKNYFQEALKIQPCAIRPKT